MYAGPYRIFSGDRIQDHLAVLTFSGSSRGTLLRLYWDLFRERLDDNPLVERSSCSFVEIDRNRSDIQNQVDGDHQPDFAQKITCSSRTLRLIVPR